MIEDGFHQVLPVCAAGRFDGYPMHDGTPDRAIRCKYGAEWKAITVPPVQAAKNGCQTANPSQNELPSD